MLDVKTGEVHVNGNNITISLDNPLPDSRGKSGCSQSRYRALNEMGLRKAEVSALVARLKSRDFYPDRNPIVWHLPLYDAEGFEMNYLADGIATVAQRICDEHDNGLIMLKNMRDLIESKKDDPVYIGKVLKGVYSDDIATILEDYIATEMATGFDNVNEQMTLEKEAAIRSEHQLFQDDAIAVLSAVIQMRELLGENKDKRKAGPQSSKDSVLNKFGITPKGGPSEPGMPHFAR